MKIISCAISNNVATSTDGGGAKIYKGSGNTTVDLLNCLIIGNEADASGGGVAFFKGRGGVVNCTFAGNVATTGGAYYQENTESPSESKIENCILWDNGSNEAHTEYGQLTVRESDVDGGSSAITAGSSGSISYDSGSFATNNINSNPQYVGGGDYHLLATSPCVHNGSTSLVPSDTEDVDEDSVTTNEKTPDRDLQTRDVCVVDMGCYERPAQCEGDADGDENIDVDDLLAVIVGWGSCGQPPVGCYGDIDPPSCGDGDVDVDDLLAVITHWGTCTTGTTPPPPYDQCFEKCGGDPECIAECLCEQGYTEFCD